MNADTPLHRLDEKERLRDLETQWVDEFVSMCSRPPQSVADLPEHERYLDEHLRRLADIEAIDVLLSDKFGWTREEDNE